MTHPFLAHYPYRPDSYDELIGDKDVRPHWQAFVDHIEETGTDTLTGNVVRGGTQTGTVGNVGTETVTDTFHSEGSSPLRTYQALIQEELDGRTGNGWNFTNIIIKDVQSMITNRVWKRSSLV